MACGDNTTTHHGRHPTRGCSTLTDHSSLGTAAHTIHATVHTSPPSWPPKPSCQNRNLDARCGRPTGPPKSASSPGDQSPPLLFTPPHCSHPAGSRLHARHTSASTRPPCLASVFLALKKLFTPPPPIHTTSLHSHRILLFTPHPPIHTASSANRQSTTHTGLASRSTILRGFTETVGTRQLTQSASSNYRCGRPAGCGLSKVGKLAPNPCQNRAKVTRQNRSVHTPA